MVNGLLFETRPHGAFALRLGPGRGGWFEFSYDRLHFGIDTMEILEQYLVFPTAEVIEYG